MTNATITVRELKNKETGIDVAITGCKEEGGLLSVKLEYSILVVSTLSCFKSDKHKPEDVVQFVIKRPEEVFVQLHHVLTLKYPKIRLPPVTATGLALFKDVDVHQQKEDFEAFLKFIVVHPELATYSYTLEFLGVNPVVAGNYRYNLSQQSDKMAATRGVSEHDIFEEEVDEDLDLFSSKSSTGLDITADTESDLFMPDTKKVTHSSSSSTRLFEDQDYGGGDNEDISELLLPGSGGEHPLIIEDNSQLLQIDDFEELLNLGQKQKPKESTTTKATDSTNNNPSLASDTSKNKPSLAPKPNSANKPNLPPKPGGKKPTKPQKPVISRKPKTANSEVNITTTNSKNAASINNDEVSSSKSESDDFNLFGGDVSVGDDFGTDDILKYIQDNRQDEPVDLFS